MSKLDILRRCCGIASAQPSVGQHYCVGLVPGNALGHSVSAVWPWPLYTGHSTFCSSIQIRFPPSPSSFTSARPGRPAKPTLATPLSVDCQSGHSNTDSGYTTLLSALSRKVFRQQSFWMSRLSRQCFYCEQFAIWNTHRRHTQTLLMKLWNGGQGVKEH